MGKYVVFVLLPKGETNPEVHSTLTYLGETHTAVHPTILCQVGQMLARFNMSPVTGYVTRHAMFGPDADTRVAMMDSPQLATMYQSVELWAQSEWGYNPHISEQPDSVLPNPGTVVLFDRIALWYGDARWCWRLGTGEACATE